MNEVKPRNLKVNEFSLLVPTIGLRHLQCFLLFWGLCFAYLMRVNFPLAIVAMTDKQTANPDFEEYDWSEQIKSLLLSSALWGATISQIPGGYLAKKFGGKISISINIFISSICAILIPYSARIGGWQMVLILQLVLGASQGMLGPSTHTILAKWTPSEERAALATYAYSGFEFGTIFAFVLGGFVAPSPLGWPGIFYISGGLGLFWLIFWYIWGANSPNECKYITAAEKSYIELSLDAEAHNKADEIAQKHMKTPWLKFFTSKPFWALLVTHSAFNWAYWTILTQIPAYMKNILGFNIQSNALLSALPYVAMLILIFVFSALSSLISRRRWLSLTKSRKFFNTLAMWVPAITLVSLGFVDASHKDLAVSLLIIAVGFGAAVYMGFFINHIDLAPNYAGIMFGCTNMAGNLMGILAPLTVGFIITDEKNAIQWRMIFIIAACFCFFGNLLFIIYGSAKVQEWNQPTPVSKNEEQS